MRKIEIDAKSLEAYRPSPMVEVIEELVQDLHWSRSDDISANYLLLAVRKLESELSKTSIKFQSGNQAGLIDFPEPYLDYLSALHAWISDLSTLIDTLNLDTANAERAQSQEQNTKVLEVDCPKAEQSDSTKPTGSTAPSMPVIEQFPELMTIPIVAHYLHKSKDWVNHNYKDWGIGYSTQGGILFRKVDIDAWLEEQVTKNRRSSSKRV